MFVTGEHDICPTCGSIVIPGPPKRCVNACEGNDDMMPVDRTRALVHASFPVGHSSPCMFGASCSEGPTGEPAQRHWIAPHSEVCESLTAAIAPLVEALAAIESGDWRDSGGEHCSAETVAREALATLDKAGT